MRTSLVRRGGSWWWTGPLLALLLASCGGELAPQQPENEFVPMALEPGLLDSLLVDAPREGTALLAAAASEGPVRVIVTLNMDVRIESELASPAAVLGQRQAIDSAGSALLSRLNVDMGTSHRFSRFPYVSLVADQATVQALLSDPAVARVVEDVPARPQMLESIPLIGADTAWGLGFDGDGYAVAVLDTGTEAGHAFFSDGLGGSAVVVEACFSSTLTSGGNQSQSACPAGSNPSGTDRQVGPGAAAPCDDAADSLARGTDDCHHGTHVAGTVGGRNGPGGLSGVAPGVGIVAVQVFSYFPGSINPGSPCNGNNCALTWSTDQMRALEWLLDLIDGVPEYPGFDLELVATNMSLGGGGTTAHCYLDSRREVIRELKAANVATIISAGNEGYWNGVGSPGCVPEAVTVGSTGDGSGGATEDVWSSFSNSHFIVDLAAPGQWTMSSIPGGGYANFAGTSMAAPHVAGAWALMRQANPEATVDDVLDMLQATGTPVTDHAGLQQRRINVDAALAWPIDDLLWHREAHPTVLTGNPYDLSSTVFAGGSGRYAAADFQVSGNQAISFIGASGRRVPRATFGSAPTWPGTITQLDWYVYADDAGRPAGHPEDGMDAHIWHLSLPVNHPAVTRRGVELQLDLTATDESLALGAGHYWLLVHATTTASAGASALTDQWMWMFSDDALSPDQQVAPVSGGHDWQDVPVSELVGFRDRAFRLRGQINVGSDPPAIVSFTATPNPMGIGGSSTLAWTVLGADQIEIHVQDGPLVSSSTSATGSVPVSPDATTSYVLTADNANGPSTAELTLSVVPPVVTSVTVSVDDDVLDVGDSTVATAQVAVIGAAPAEVSWSSSDPAVISVDADGVVTAVAPGLAQVIATSVFTPSVSGGASVTVQSPPSDSASLSFTEVFLPNQSAQLGADDVPVLAVDAEVPVGSRTVQLQGAGLRVIAQGVAAGDPVDSSGLLGVNLYYDANGNRQVDVGDTLLGSSGSFATDGSASLSFGATLDIFAGGTAALLVSYDLADQDAAAPAWLWWAALLFLPPSVFLFRGGRRRLAMALLSVAMLLAACGGGGAPAGQYRYRVELSSVTVASVPGGVTPSVTGLPLTGAMVTFPRP